MNRLVALVLLPPLIQLNVARADIACASHASPGAAASQPHDAHESHESAPAPEESCDAPAQTECCEALASCGPVLGLDPTLAMQDVPSSTAVDVALRGAPVSTPAAPEPPPPRV